MMDVSAAQVVQAIRVLYGDPDSSRKAEANTWLISFASSPSAWGIGFPLLEAEAVEVRYFIANMILSKVHTEWSLLPVETRLEITMHIFESLTTYMTAVDAPAVVVNRICLVAAAIAARAPPSATSVEDSKLFRTQHLISNALDAAATAVLNPGDVGQQTLLVVLALLQAVAEESEQLDISRKNVVMLAMQERIMDVMAMLEAILFGHLAGGVEARGEGRLAVPMLHLMLAWLKVDSLGPSPLTVGQLGSKHGRLLHFILVSLSAKDVLVGEAAVETLVELFANGGEKTAEDKQVLQVILSTVLSQWSQLIPTGKQSGEDGGKEWREEVERGLCRVVVSVAEFSPEFLALLTGGEGNLDSSTSMEGVVAAEMMLDCGDRGDRSVVEAVVEFYTMMNTVPVSKRRPEFRGPLFGRLLQLLIHKAGYPKGFTSWAEEVDDEDSFRRFREQVVADGLDTCFTLLNSQYLDYVGSVLDGARDWGTAEAAIFAIHCISHSVKTGALSSQGGQARALEAQQKCNSFLSRLFERISQDPEGGLFSSHPQMVASASRLSGLFASWLALFPASLEGILGYVIRALRVPEATKQAAFAFGSLCARCSQHLRSTPLVSRLVDAAHASLAALTANRASTGQKERSLADVDIEDRVSVMAGLARLAVNLPPEDAAAVSIHLATPMITEAYRLAGTRASTGGQGSEGAALAIQLKLLSTVVQFLEVGNEPEKSASRYGQIGAVWPVEDLPRLTLSGQFDMPGTPSPPHRSQPRQRQPGLEVMEASWPLLSGIQAMPSWRADAQVMEALCAVYSRLFLCVKQQGLPLLPALGPLLVIFDEFQHPACLQVLGTALEVCSRTSSWKDSTGTATSESGSGPSPEEIHNLFSSALDSACKASFSLMQRGQLAQQPEVLEALFSVAHRYITFMPAVILAFPLLPHLFQAASVVVRHQERDSSRAAISFITQLLSPGEKASAFDVWVQNRRAVDLCASEHGEIMTASLLYAATNSLRRDLVRPLAGALYALLTKYPTTAGSWLFKALSSPEFSGMQGRNLGQTGQQLVCELALKQPPLPRPRFEAMIADFANVCRCEQTVDVLVAYQM